jgi:membrane protease subunit (stomatin/prohibitin family)
MRHVYTGRDEMDAHFVKGLLEQEGIAAVVTGENLEATWSTLPLSATSLPGVYVPDEDEARAAGIVREYQQVDRANADDAVADAPRATWKCANCGEAVEEQFTECWNCGHSRPGGSAAVVNPVDGPH